MQQASTVKVPAHPQSHRQHLELILHGMEWNRNRTRRFWHWIDRLKKPAPSRSTRPISAASQNPPGVYFTTLRGIEGKLKIIVLVVHFIFVFCLMHNSFLVFFTHSQLTSVTRRQLHCFLWFFKNNCLWRWIFSRLSERWCLSSIRIW